MFFFCLALFLALGWLAPWWAAALAALALGWARPASPREIFQLGGASALAWAALAYIKDGRNFGLISQRLAGMFNLPHPLLVYVCMGLIAFATVVLCAQAGASLRLLLTSDTK